MSDYEEPFIHWEPKQVRGGLVGIDIIAYQKLKDDLVKAQSDLQTERKRYAELHERELWYVEQLAQAKDRYDRAEKVCDLAYKHHVEASDDRYEGDIREAALKWEAAKEKS